MEDEDFEKPQISKLKIAGFFFIFLVIAWGASTLAGTITINANNRIEFGQGVYNLKACDSFVQLDPRSGPGGTLVQYLDVSGFDKKKCKNKYFAIRFQSNGNNLVLFSNGSRRVVLHVDNSDEPNVSLVYTYGDTPGSDIPAIGDGLQRLAYSSSTGVYTVEFLNPIVTVSSVTGTTFESAGTFSSLSSD